MSKIVAESHLPDVVHPHAQVVARRWHLPVERLAYLDDPDQIDEIAEIMVRRRERSRQTKLRLYWSLFYGGTGLLLVTGLLFSLILVAVAILWLMAMIAVGFVLLKPAE